MGSHDRFCPACRACWRPRRGGRAAGADPPAGGHGRHRGVRRRGQRAGRHHPAGAGRLDRRAARGCRADRRAAHRRGPLAGGPPRGLRAARDGPHRDRADRDAAAGPGADPRGAAVDRGPLGGPAGPGDPAPRGRLRGPGPRGPVRAGGRRAGAGRAVHAGHALAAAGGRVRLPDRPGGRGTRRCPGAGPLAPPDPPAAPAVPGGVPRVGRRARRADRGGRDPGRRLARAPA